MRKNKKLTAFALLLIHGLSVFYPGVSYALTNGPTAPESSQFQAASVSNLVDPFSGDFSYNIPLMDVDGYPINIAYNSGGSMDDEASWVGYGWNINPGSISRVMKGIPDDFNGSDKIKKDYNLRPDITGGVSFNLTTELFGLDFLGANASADIFYNNQRGLGVEIGAGISATLSTAKHSSGEYTAGLSGGANLGITSNSQTGADFNFGANIGISAKDKENATGSLGLRFGGSLNSRAGMKSTTLSGSFNTSKKESEDDETARKEKNVAEKTNVEAPGEKTSSGSLGSTTSNYGMAFTPTISMPMKNESFSLSPQLGSEFWGFQVPAIQVTGHYSQQRLATSHKEFPAYGFLYSNAGRNNPNALLDFNREKDAPYMDNTPTLSVPYVTQDVFTASSHLGSSQFKAFSNSSGVFFDSYNTNTSLALSVGVEFGAGGGVKGGVDLSGSGSSTVSRKWTGNNDFLQNGDFTAATGADGENAYFKLVGEKSSINKEYLNKIADRTAVKIQTANVDDQAKAFSTLVSNTASYPVSSAIARNKREPKGEVLVPLTADQAKNFGLDKTINNYTPVALNEGFTCNNGVFGNFTALNRVNDIHKGHHFSEVKVLKNDGMRLIYGVPVYNNEQVDITMSVGRKPNAANNIVNYDANDATTKNSKGIDHYFSQETIPSYATSFLLSGICSPDYVDVTGNGISDDDLGAAVKFNYSLVNSHYNWRTPNDRNNTNYANFSEGNRCQADDDKASISYGNKELWYAHSIESKNMVAVFRLGTRHDGYGYNKDGLLDELSQQKKLERIDLYTKAELLSNPVNPVPIKSVVFDYDYSLFSDVPNNLPGGGKLTLKSIYFTYGKSISGEENRYYFKYNESGLYQYQQYDRWGTFKDKNWNNSIANIDLNNNDFPYSIQNKTKADEAANKWQLSEIELPSGGKIKVEYESDDYAYVQNKRAMQMAKIVGYGTLGNYSGYQETDKIYIQLPGASTNSNVKWEYFDGVEQLYFKSMINLDNKGNSELVSGYAKIKNIAVVNGNIAEVTLEKRGNYHPVAAAAWQFLRQNLPKLAYSYSLGDDDKLSPMAFVKALVSAIRNVGELLTPFESKAMRQGFASNIIPNQGFARIGTRFIKYGGGLRVKKIIMDDIWADMVGNTNGASTTTGMEFNYTQKIKLPNGTETDISSGVASYEPMAGGEENPFRQPITYQQKAHLTSSIYTVEEPLGESYFPAPSVGYSQVTIKNLDATGNAVSNGYSVKKFFTAKDFPTIVKRTDLSKNKYNQSSIFGLFNIDQGNSVVLSQGFYVETNDMHGKPLSDETFDGTGKMLSGSYNHYKSSGTEQMVLDNNVLTLQPDGTVKNEVVAQEFEMYHDMREQITDNIGVNLNINLDVLFFVFVTLPIPTFIPIVQSTHCGYEAASTIKVVSRYAIPDKVTTIENGSTMTSENVLWDALTGQVLLTKTQNGFDDPLYNFALPAYLVNEYEKGMGAAYKNTGIVFNNITVGSGLLPAALTGYIVTGDELGISGTVNKIWATAVPGGTRLINKDGSMYSGTATLILLRSGRRNMMGASTYSVVSLKSPIRNGKVDIDMNTEVLNTSAGTFSDEWTSETKNTSCINWPQGGRTAENVSYNSTDSSKTGEVVLGGGGGGTCSPCDSNSYTIVRTYGTSCGKIRIDVSYNCPGQFPANATAVLTFAPYCNGAPCQSKTIIINSQNTSGSVCFFSTGDVNVICPCPTVSMPVKLESITGTACEGAPSCCPPPVDQKVNPFYIGLKGNWRGKQSYVYTTERNARVDANNTAKLPTNTRKGGIFSTFTSFYKVLNGKFVSIITNSNPVGYNNEDLFVPSDNKWIASATVKKVNSKGQEVENKDALNKYSAAQFGFNELVTTAVASNSRNYELAYDGFEDYAYTNSCGNYANADNCNEDGHFNFKSALRLAGGSGFAITNAEAHTGNYSVMVNGGNQTAGYTRRELRYNFDQLPMYAFNGSNEMLLKGGGILESFKPVLSQKYVLSGWIKGDVAAAINPTDGTKGKIIIEAWNETSSSPYYTAIAVKAGPKVEGWTRVMVTFEVPGNLAGSRGDYIKLRLVAGNQNTYFDDIRIHPYDANMKSFAYDYRTSRLMAELDENNYATFFEYNDEGQLLRNKKETEKGIVTLKETRSRVRKNKR